MKNAIRHWALGLLLLNLAIFIAVLLAQRHGVSHPALGYIKAFAEAACIGALADWFAVVALFRHPLGIPLPHTAILPAKQAQLAQGVAKFIGTNFLEPQIIADQLARLRVGERVNAYAQAQLTTQAIAQRLPSLLHNLMQRVPAHAPDALINWSTQALVNYAQGDRLGRGGARLIDAAQAQSLDKTLVNALAASVHEFVTQDNIKERVRPWLTELISAAQKADASWWDKVKTQFTGQAIEWADDWILDKAIAWLTDFSSKIQHEPEHPVHQWVAAHINGWRNQLHDNPNWHDWLAPRVHAWLQSDNAHNMVHSVWHKSRAWLDAATQPDSPSIEPLAGKIRDLVLGYMASPEQQAKLTDKAAHVAAHLLTEHQNDIRDWLTSQMNAWSKERLTGALENAIGRDLQYIRINGTLIGGLIGLMLYVVSQILLS
ncbi:MAG: DUF445 domain-containing protein [Formosimonas sp.]